MTCYKCNTQFCFLCGVRLNREHPYLHFNDPGQACYNLLFEGVDQVTAGVMNIDVLASKCLLSTF
jgi:hypothetical protein